MDGPLIGEEVLFPSRTWMITTADWERLKLNPVRWIIGLIWARTRATTLVARKKMEVLCERSQSTTNESHVSLFIFDTGHPAAGLGIRK